MSDVTLDLYPADGGTYSAEVQVLPGRPWADVAARSASLSLDAPSPPESGVRRLTFHEAVAYPQGLQPLRDRHGLLYVYLYRATDREALIAFDRRIRETYTEFFVTTGEHPAGTFDVDGLAAGCIGELAAMDAVSPAEFRSRTANLTLPPDVEQIVAECRDLQDRSFERYVLWLTPRS